MANMGHCRFENTTGDLMDCVEAFEELEQNEDGQWGQYHYEGGERRWEALNEYEQPKVRELAELAKRFVYLYENATMEELPD